MSACRATSHQKARPSTPPFGRRRSNRAFPGSSRDKRPPAYCMLSGQTFLSRWDLERSLRGGSLPLQRLKSAFRSDYATKASTPDLRGRSAPVACDWHNSGRRSSREVAGRTSFPDHPLCEPMYVGAALGPTSERRRRSSPIAGKSNRSASDGVGYGASDQCSFRRQSRLQRRPW